jgi:hypothetical protein
MLLTIVLIAGFGFGWLRAKRRGGDRFDKLQYGAVHAIIFSLGAFIAWILAIKLGLL